MPLAFLAPLFLAGIAAIAIPVWVHLRHREKGDPVDFPSLMFLMRVPHRAERRQRIRHWPLFLLRVLALVLLAAAFARPFMTGDAAGERTATGSRELVLLVDVSHSMRFGDRWTRARAAAQEALASMSGDDRGTIVLFDREARIAAGPTSNRGELDAVLAAAEPGDAATNLIPGIEAAQRIFADSDHPRRAVHVVSDFQRAGLPAEERARLPHDVELTWTDVSDRAWTNRFVSGITIRREVQSGRPVAIVGARIVARASDPGQDTRAQPVEATLMLEDREVARRRVLLPPTGAAVVAFTPVAIPPNDARAVVRLSADGLPGDDRFHFVLARSDAIPVTLVERGASTLYVRRALEIGDSPSFDVKPARPGVIQPGAGGGVVMLLDAAPTAADGRRLTDFVRDGGGLVIVAGTGLVSSAWPATADSLLPATPGGTVDRLDGRGATIASIELTHLMFAPFAATAGSEFTTARFWRHRTLTPPSEDAVLARFDDGSPALVERRFGAGRVLMWAAPLDNSWSDFAVRAVFLPFVHQLVKYASGYASERTSFVVGERVASRRGSVALERAGFTTVEVLEGRTERERTVAANVDPAESDLAAMDAREFAAAVLPDSAAASRESGARAALTAVEREARQNMWWYLVAAAVLLLAAEMVIAARTAPVRAERIEDGDAAALPRAA